MPTHKTALAQQLGGILIIFAIGLVSGNSSVWAENGKTTVESKGSFLGLRFGCSIQEANAVFKQGEIPDSSISHNTFEGKGERMYFEGNHRLKGATITKLVFWDGKLVSVIVYFRDNAEKGLYMTMEKLFNVLENKLQKKYGKAEIKRVREKTGEIQGWKSPLANAKNEEASKDVRLRGWKSGNIHIILKHEGLAESGSQKLYRVLNDVQAEWIRLSATHSELKAKMERAKLEAAGKDVGKI